MTGHLAVPGVDTPMKSGGSSYTLVNTPSPASREVFQHDDPAETDPRYQLEALDNKLETENRIKEGAERLLATTAASDALRQHVTAELELANGRIAEIVSKRNDIQALINTSPTQRRRTLPRETNVIADDFRTVLHNATTYVHSLSALALSPRDGQEPAELDKKYGDLMTGLTRILQQSLRVRYELDLSEVIQAAIPALADARSKHCRASAFRLIRYLLVDAKAVQRLDEQRLEWYIVKSLTRDSKYAVEKEQTIKLIRTIVDTGIEANSPGSGAVPLSEPIMRALIALAEHTESPFRPICLQTLTEIMLIDIDLVARTGGIKVLLHCLGDGPTELAPLVISAFLRIVDSPRTRAYLNLGTDIELAFTPVTDAYGKGPEQADTMRSCTRVIQMILRSWSGLMYLCMDDMQPIRLLIDLLRIPSLDNREIILDMFFELINVKSDKAPAWHQAFLVGRRLTVYGKPRIGAPEIDKADRSSHTLKLTDQYIAILILVFTNAGLIDALTELLEESAVGNQLTRKATLLLAELLQMTNRVLPLSVAARLQAMPRVFAMASDYKDAEHRIVGTATLSALDSLNRNRTRLEPIQTPNRNRANSIEDAVRRGQRQVEQVRLKMGMQMDDRTFQSSLLETQVMLTKEHSKWNFDTLQDLIEGPLLNPKRMEEAIKGARFIKRLMSFFHPFSHRFSDMIRSTSNMRWIKLGCSLMTTLLATSEGIRYLSTEDHFLEQIMKSFAQLDPFNGVPDSDPIFSKRRVSDTLTCGYFEMLGALSKHKDGIEMMEKFKIFTAFYHLSELKSREDLIKGIIQNLDYSMDGHPRIVLSKALTSSYKHVRLYATHHLGDLIRASPSANAWTLRLLLTQLYDPASEVCEKAIHILKEACESKDILQLVVEMRPTMDHLGEIGNPLLLKFTSTPMGFRYLFDAGYIEREIDLWYNERNLYYVVQVEVFLAKTFQSLNNTEEDDEALTFEGIVPPHFYGEMAKTELGCQVLQDKSHFSDFAQFIRQHGLEADDPELIMKLKSLLWAVGNVGATDGGLPFLEEEDIIPAILDIVTRSPIPSVRGTCVFVLGLISTTAQGADILDDYNWEATLSPLGQPTGLCIPIDLDRVLHLPPWEQFTPERHLGKLLPPGNPLELEVLTALQNLANTVIANAASRSLAKMKARPEYRPVFASTEVFYRALQLISTQRYRLPVRRYIMDLFNVELHELTAAELTKCCDKLRAPAAFKPPLPDTKRASVFGGVIRRRNSESDEESEIAVGPVEGLLLEDKVPAALSLKPLHRVVGFAVEV